MTIALVLLCIAACGCPRYPITEAVSPAHTRRYTAQAYENNCGVLSDKNIVLALKETSLYDTDEAMAIFNIYWTVRLEWTAHDRLHVTFECPPDEYGCGIGHRHWIADWKTTWRDVHITYTASPRGPAEAVTRRSAAPAVWSGPGAVTRRMNHCTARHRGPGTAHHTYEPGPVFIRGFGPWRSDEREARVRPWLSVRGAREAPEPMFIRGLRSVLPGMMEGPC